MNGLEVIKVEHYEFIVGMGKFLKCLEDGILQLSMYSEAEIICPVEYLEGLDPKVMSQIPLNEPLIMTVKVK